MTDADVAALDAAVEDDVDQLESLDSASRTQQLQVGEIFIGVRSPVGDVPPCDVCMLQVTACNMGCAHACRGWRGPEAR